MYILQCVLYILQCVLYILQCVMKFIEKAKAFFTEENKSKLWCANKKNP